MMRRCAAALARLSAGAPSASHGLFTQCGGGLLNEPRRPLASPPSRLAPLLPPNLLPVTFFSSSAKKSRSARGGAGGGGGEKAGAFSCDDERALLGVMRHYRLVSPRASQFHPCLVGMREDELVAKLRFLRGVLRMPPSTLRANLSLLTLSLNGRLRPRTVLLMQLRQPEALPDPKRLAQLLNGDAGSFVAYLAERGHPSIRTLGEYERAVASRRLLADAAGWEAARLAWAQWWGLLPPPSVKPAARTD